MKFSFTLADAEWQCSNKVIVQKQRILKRIFSTRRLGLCAASSLAMEQNKGMSSDRRNAQRRLSQYRRHDDVPDGPERRTHA